MCYVLIDFVNIIKVQALNIRKKNLALINLHTYSYKNFSIKK